MTDKTTSIAVPPRAASLSESLRGMGYSLDTAVADIIDNSIAAGAGLIEVDLRLRSAESEPWLRIRDDGSGMNREALINALALGSVSPLQERRIQDLGRFGLGLKTASFSQCRRLTVASKHDGVIRAFCWDLDLLAQTDQWDLIELSDPEADPRIEIPSETGTVVLWDKPDRTLNLNSDAPKTVVSGIVTHLKNHLRLTFHRFLEEDGGLEIRFNGRPISGWDPFLSQDPGRPREFAEDAWPPYSFNPDVLLRVFVLPNPETATREITLFGPEDITELQGFFIYRGRRLITAGGWLGLRGLGKGPEFGLARIRLDFGNGLDAQWRLDIRKSIAHPPREMREWLTNHAVIARTLSEAELRSSGGNARRDAPARHLWKRPKGGGPALPDASDPVLQAVYTALSAGTLTPELLKGVFEIMAYAHPAAVRSASTAHPSEEVLRAVEFLRDELTQTYGDEAEAILRGREPFASWQALIQFSTEDSE